MFTRNEIQQKKIKAKKQLDVKEAFLMVLHTHTHTAIML